MVRQLVGDRDRDPHEAGADTVAAPQQRVDGLLLPILADRLVIRRSGGVQLDCLRARRLRVAVEGALPDERQTGEPIERGKSNAGVAVAGGIRCACAAEVSVRGRDSSLRSRAART
jgi:hypothetical protein